MPNQLLQNYLTALEAVAQTSQAIEQLQRKLPVLLDQVQERLAAVQAAAHPVNQPTQEGT